MGLTAIVVADRPDGIATWMPEGAPFVFAEGHPISQVGI
jgi:hypothetical protein